MWTSTLPFQVIYVFCVTYGIFSDIRNLMIPNWVSLILVIAFLPYSFLFWPDPELLSRLAITAAIFLLSFLFYHLNWFGGGDLKLLTAVSLWMGPAHIAAFSMLMAGLGSLLALLLIILRRAVNVRGTVSPDRLPKIVRRWVEEGVCPYGIAIGAAALAMGPQIFS